VTREKSEFIRRQGMLDAEIKMVKEVCESVIVRGHTLTPQEVGGKLEPIRKYLNVDAYLNLLQEREQVGAQVVDRIKQLRVLTGGSD